MTLTNIGNYHLKKSKNCKNYIYIFHSLVSTQRGYEKEAFKNYDIIFTASEYQKNELLKAEQIYKFPRKKIFNIGYFYFENIFKKVKLYNTNPKNILFAPTWHRTVKNLFDDLERKRDIADFLELTEKGEGVRIFIGSENKLFSLTSFFSH